VAYLQGDNYWTKAHPSYFDFLAFWDAEWYSRIFDHGYPTELPTNSDGSAMQNEWAFLPLFPYLVRLMNLLTGLEWKFVAPMLALVFSFAAALLAYRLFARHLTSKQSLWAVAILGLWGASPTLQAGYAESLGLVFFAWTLLLVDRERYLASLLPTALLSVTRPGALAIALMLALIFAHRWWHRNTEEGFERMRWQLLTATAASGVLGLLWSAVAWFSTGRMDAYISTELAWRSGYTGKTHFEPFVSWIIGFNWLSPGPSGWILLALVVGLVVWSLLLPQTIALGLTMRTWMAAYWGYLFVFFYPQSSTFRILLPMLPLFALLAVATASSKARMWFLGTALSAFQLWWLLECWMYTAPDFTPP
jgi:hypothetical protein